MKKLIQAIRNTFKPDWHRTTEQIFERYVPTITMEKEHNVYTIFIGDYDAFICGVERNGNHYLIMTTRDPILNDFGKPSLAKEKCVQVVKGNVDKMFKQGTNIILHFGHIYTPTGYLNEEHMKKQINKIRNIFT